MVMSALSCCSWVIPSSSHGSRTFLRCDWRTLRYIQWTVWLLEMEVCTNLQILEQHTKIRTGMAHSVGHLHKLCRMLDPRVEYHQCVYTHLQLYGSNRLHCHVGHQEVSRDCTRGESEESIECRWWSMQVTKDLKLWYWTKFYLSMFSRFIQVLKKFLLFQ